MSTRSPSTPPDDHARLEQGFTLIEVVICVVLLTMITGAITAALISSLQQSSVNEPTRARVERRTDHRGVSRTRCGGRRRHQPGNRPT